MRKLDQERVPESQQRPRSSAKAKALNEAGPTRAVGLQDERPGRIHEKAARRSTGTGRLMRTRVEHPPDQRMVRLDQHYPHRVLLRGEADHISGCDILP